MPEFEVILSAAGKKFEAILIDARNEDAALSKAAALAKKHGAIFFEVRRPVSQRWVRRD